MITRKWILRGKLGLLAVTISLIFCGCDSSGRIPSSVSAEREENAEKREKLIKDLYKAKKPYRVKKTA